MTKFSVYFFVLCGILYGDIVASTPLDVHHSVNGKADEFTYRLPNNTRPEFYEVQLVTFIDRGEFNFSGTVRIDVHVLEESKTITLHARRLTIDSVQLSDSYGNPIEDDVTFAYDVTKEFLTISTGKTMLQRGEKYLLKIFYIGELRTDLGGFYRSSYVNAQGTKVWLATTQFESTDARHGFPCYDEPGIKANYSIHIQHGPTYTAISNMPGTPQTNSDGSVTTHFATTPLMSSYLVAFIVSDFVYKKNDKDFVHRVFAAPKDVNRTSYGLREGEALLNAISNYVGVPFTLPKMDQAAIPQFSAGAMENWGLVTYREQYLLFDEDVNSYSRQTDITTVISHEFGHQWFGDLVSPKWWNYIWLNEGFATLFQFLGTDLVHPDWNIFEDFVLSTMQGIMRSDASDSTHPMTYYVESPQAISGIFDGITYSKSGSVLRMFLHAFTEDSFKKALTYYLNAKAFQAAEENDLFVALERAVKEDKTLDEKLNVNDIFTSWSHQKGFPLLNVSRNYEDGSLTLYQERYTSKYPHPDAKKYTWWIPYNLVSNSNGDFNVTKPDGWLSADSASKRIESSGSWSNDDWIVLNKQETGYYRVLYDEKNYELITKEINSGDNNKIHPLSRAQLIDDLKDFVNTGRVPPQRFFDLIAYIKRESHYAPWHAARRAIDDIDGTLGGSDKQKVFHSFVASLVEPVYRKVGLTSSEIEVYSNKKLRDVVTDLACAYGVQLCIDQTRQQFDRILRGRDIPSPNSRSLVFAHGIRSADELQVKILWIRFENSKNDEERKEILSSIGNIKNKAIIKQYLKKALQPSDSFTKIERQVFVKSVAFGSQFGLSSVMKLLADNMSEAKVKIGNIEKLLKKLSDRVLTPQMSRKFSKLLQVAKTSSVITEQDMKDLQNTVAEKVNWVHANKAKIENSIPVVGRLSKSNNE